jgi:WhiB family redox-sensing transcriptional regulator
MSTEPTETPELAETSGIAQLDRYPSAFEEELPCRRENPELWFAEAPVDLEKAKVHCVECPLRSACLDGALERREPWGVWGGEIFDRGAVIAHKRPRGRPRKEATAA